MLQRSPRTCAIVINQSRNPTAYLYFGERRHFAKLSNSVPRHCIASSSHLNPWNDYFDRAVQPYSHIFQQRRTITNDPHGHPLSGLAKLYNPETNPGVNYCIKYLEWFHDISGLPWWGTIISAAILARLTIFPLYWYGMYKGAVIQNVNKKLQVKAYQMDQNLQQMQRVIGFSDKEREREFQEAMKTMRTDHYESNMIHTLQPPIASLLQVPLWLCMTAGLRNMSGLPLPFTRERVYIVPEFAEGGVAWFPNLLLPDTSMTLGIITFAILISTSQLTLLSLRQRLKGRPMPLLAKGLVTFGHVGAVWLLYLSSILPSSMVLYWAVSGGYSLALNLAILSPKVQNALKIPVTFLNPTPYRSMMIEAKRLYLKPFMSQPEDAKKKKRS